MKDEPVMIYLMRHGEINGVKTRRYIGSTDLPLSEKGIVQAQFWHQKLNNIRFDAIYTSPLERAMHTAEIISGQNASALKIIPDLAEIHLGEWDGKKVQSIQKRFPDAWKQRGSDFAGFRPPGGESFQDLSNRVLPAFFDITSCDQKKILLLVAHAGVNRVILARLLDHPLADLFQIPQNYGALNLIRRDKGRLSVQEINLYP